MAHFANQPPRPPVRKGIGYQKPRSELPKSEGATEPTEAVGQAPETEKTGNVQEVSRVPEAKGVEERPRQKAEAPKGGQIGRWRKRSELGSATSPARAKDPVRLDLRDRIEERKSARRRLIIYRVAWGLGVVAALGGLAWLTFFSTLFAFDAETVEVQGVQSGDLEQKVYEVTSVHAGVPLPRVPTGRIERELSEVADVAQVDVARSWPSSLVVSIKERTPSAVVSVGREKLVVGEDGVVLREAMAEDEALPIVVLGEADRESLEENAASAVEVWSSLSPTLSEKVESIEVKRRRATLNLLNGTEVIWGESTQGEQKSEVVELLMENREAAVYDVSDPRRPVTR